MVAPSFGADLEDRAAQTAFNPLLGSLGRSSPLPTEYRFLMRSTPLIDLSKLLVAFFFDEVPNDVYPLDHRHHRYV
jgi:hypothetical protein